jgi:tetraacyldisaccharide 4'-kinase
MHPTTVHIKKWLLPFSWLYGFIIFIRNKLFEWHILEQKSYDIPIICVGNITVGGTGKTPHTEYLVELLSQQYRVAVLSRGYKRKSKGFQLATIESTSLEIGDEPYQIKRKYPEVIVAVDAKRTRGIETLLALPNNERPEVIILDDAFQHRYVKPSFTILLTDYNRLISQDKLLPAGKLREPAYYAEYANIIIVTKCPKGLNPLDQRIAMKEIHPYPYQSLLYTSFSYGKLTPVFSEQEPFALNKVCDKDVLLVTGIANPEPFYKKIKRYIKHPEIMQYPDHYHFSKKDIADIKKKYDKLPNDNKIIIVTEKDAARFRSMKDLPEELKNALYYLPIKVTFINQEDQEIFNNKIINHVRENTSNS